MKISIDGINLIKAFEGCLLKPYLDQVSVPTIGYGSTYYDDGRRVTMDDPPISQERADQLFYKVLQGFSDHVDLMLISSAINQPMFDALTSFAYNVGLGALQSSTLLKKVNANCTDPTIRDEFMKWDHGMANGELIELPGLKARREAEANFYFKQDF